MFTDRGYNEPIERVNLSTKDPDFWGLYGDEYQKKEAAGKLDSWWGKQKKNLPMDLPKASKLDRIFQSFDKALGKDEKIETDAGHPIACDQLYVSQDSVYLLLSQHYEVDAQRIRDIWYEI